MLVVSVAALTAYATGTAPMLQAARPAVRIRMQADDPIGSPFVKAINALQEAIQTSPIAKFKKQMAVMQAGDYDKPAVSAKLESLISDNGAVMFSFTT